MKKVLSTLIIIALVAAPVVATATNGAGDGNFGLGLQLGNPTGISAKYWLNSENAIDVTIGLNLMGTSLGTSYGISSNVWSGSLLMGYLWHFPDLFDIRSGSLLPYIGVGGMLTVLSVHVEGYGYEYGETGLGFYCRIPAGLEYIHRPLSFYGELDPLLGVTTTSVGSALGFGLGGGLGIRFYF